jgi:hypothetical protein
MKTDLLKLEWTYKLDAVKSEYYNGTNNIIIAKDADDKGIKQYAVIQADKLQLLKENNINAYECILTHNETERYDDRIYKFYIDIDIKVSTDEDIAVIDKIRIDFCNEILRNMKDKFPSQIKDTEAIIYLNSSGLTANNEYKYSYHAIFPIYTSHYKIHHIISSWIINNILSKYNNQLPKSKYNNSLIDKAVYTDNPTKSRLFRLPYQTKINSNRQLIPLIPIDNYTDYLITEFDKTKSNICEKDLKEGKILSKLPKTYHTTETMDEYKKASVAVQQSILKTSYKTAKISDDYIKDTLKSYSELEARVRLYLINIINTYECRQDWIIWFKVITNLKRIGKNDFNNEDYFKELAKAWSIGGFYKEYKQKKQIERNIQEVKEATDGFNRKFESITTEYNTHQEKINSLYSIYNLHNYAIANDPEIRKRIELQLIMIRLYDFKLIQEITPIISDTDKEVNFIPYENNLSLTTNENIGRAKTTAFIQVILKNCVEQPEPNELKTIKNRYNKSITKATNDDEKRTATDKYKHDLEVCKRIIPRYIIFSNRCIFGEDFKAKINKSLQENGLKPVYYYEDKIPNSKIILEEYSGIICSIESLYKNQEIINRLIKTAHYYTFFDEIETLLTSLTGATKNINETATINLLLKIWENATINISCDAYLSKKGIDFINDMNKITNRQTNHIYLHSNHHNPYPKTINICMNINSKGDNYIDCMDELKLQFVEILKNPENRICILCEEVKQISDFHNLFEELAKDPIYNFNMKQNYQEHTGYNRRNQTIEEYQHSLRMFKDNTLFEPIRVWIYNTCLMNGVSVSNVYFNNCFVIMGNFGDTAKGTIKANDMMNAMGRARKSDVWNAYFCNNPMNNMNNIELDDQNIQQLIDNENVASLNTKLINNTLDYDATIKEKDKRISKIIEYESNKHIYYSQIITHSTYREIIYYRYAQAGEEVKRSRRAKVIDDNGKIIKNYDEEYIEVYDIPMKIITEYYKEPTTYDYADYEELINKGIIVNNRITDMMNRLKINSVYETNANLIFKKDLFIQLAKLKGNIIIDKTEQIKEDCKEITTNINYNLLTPSGDALIIPDIKENTERYFIDKKIDEYYKEGIHINRLLIHASPEYKRLFNNWVNLHENKKEGNITPIYIKQVINILSGCKGENHINLPEIITTDDINIYNKRGDFNIVIGEYLKSVMKKPDIKLSLMKVINDIIYPIGFKYESDGGKRETTGARLRKYTYTLKPTIKNYEGKVKYQDTEYNIDWGVYGLRECFNWGDENDDQN